MCEYLEIRGTVPESAETVLAESLSSIQVLGVQVLSTADGTATMGVWLRADDAGLADEVEAVLTGLGSASVERFPRRDEDWAAGWRASLKPFEVGERWWIDPHPEGDTAAPDGRIRLAIEPRSAFGAGTHESTRLVLLQLERSDCLGMSVLDIGTGSGVLALAADARGALRVVAVDTDLIAVWEAKATAARQSWPCRPLLVAGTVDCLGGVAFDLVVCNMIVSEFGPMIADIRRLLSDSGTVVLSGILESERRAVVEMLGEGGLAVSGEMGLGEWISLRATRAGTS